MPNAASIRPHPAATDPRVEIIGHRGAAHDAPENTVAAVQLAWQQNADAVEFDVHRTRDDRIVVIHDRNTQRTARGACLVIADSLLEELRPLDVGAWKGPQFAGEKIPTLNEMLATVPDGKRVFVEVKSGPEIVPELDRVFKASQLEPDQTAVISFDANVIAAVKQARPDLPAYWLVTLDEEASPSAEVLIARAKDIRADGLDVSAADALDARFAGAVRAARLKLYTWTVNDPAVARRMVALGVDGITTDRPGWLRSQLAQ